MPDDHDEAADLADGVGDEQAHDTGASDTEVAEAGGIGPDAVQPDDEGRPTGTVVGSARPTLWSLLGPGRGRPAAPTRTEDVARGMKRLDERERKWGLGAVALLIAGALALYVPRLSHNTTVTTVWKKVHGVWPTHSGCAPMAKTCPPLLTVYHPSYYLLPALVSFALIAILAIGLARSMRTLSIFTAFLGGLALGGSILSTLGAFAWGIWVLARSWRLSKYGTKDAKAASQVSKERLAERKEAKRTKATGTAPPTPAGRPHPERSKRYTPAKSARQAKR